MGDKAKDKIIAYVPHGINEETFRPINEGDKHWDDFVNTKKKLFGGKEYDHIFFFNSRNIRRKCISMCREIWVSRVFFFMYERNRPR